MNSYQTELTFCANILYSPWDQGQTGIKLGAEHVTYQKLANFM